MPTDTWVCPAGVTSIFAECWGSGSKGGAPGLGTGDSGGGGSYARKQVSVTPGNSYNVEWGPGSTNTQTTFDVSVSAAPCVDAITGADGSGNLGDVKHNGGNGRSGQFTDGDHTFPGRGGGSSGGRNSNGTNASGQTGASVTGGGKGGDGGDPGPPSQNPSCGTNGSTGGPGPGGGGGGSGWSIFCGTIAAGQGGAGAIYIWNATGGGDFAAVSSDAANIVGTFGSVPPAPPMFIATLTGSVTLTGFAPTVSVGVEVTPGTGSVTMTGKAPTVVFSVSPKFRKRAFVM